MLLMVPRVSWRVVDLFRLQHFPLLCEEVTIGPHMVNTLLSEQVASFSKSGKDTPFLGVLTVIFNQPRNHQSFLTGLGGFSPLYICSFVLSDIILHLE